MSRSLLLCVAGGMLSVLLGLQLFVLRPLALGLLLLGCVLLLWAAVAVVRPHLRRRDPYDLKLLSEVDERASWAEADEVEIESDASIVCPNCGQARDARIPGCPNCTKIVGF
ncbi:MAG TPA: hypothetical protein VM328_13645 [Fimbriimonadaceae bacterium]|nr:hypothetical protein [Fimbriimonadaceae bacterium]